MTVNSKAKMIASPTHSSEDKTEELDKSFDLRANDQKISYALEFAHQKQNFNELKSKSKVGKRGSLRLTSKISSSTPNKD